MNLVTEQTDEQISNQKYWDVLARTDSLTTELSGLRIQLRESEEARASMRERLLRVMDELSELLDAVEDLEYLVKRERSESQRLRQICRMQEVDYEQD